MDDTMLPIAEDIRRAVEMVEALQRSLDPSKAETGYFTSLFMQKAVKDLQSGNKPLPSVPIQKMVLRLPRPLHDFFKYQAERKGISLHQVLLDILTDGVYREVMARKMLPALSAIAAPLSTSDEY